MSPATIQPSVVVTRWLRSAPINAAVAGQPDQRDQRERNPEREHDLRQHQRARWIQTTARIANAGDQRDQPAQQQRDHLRSKPAMIIAPAYAPTEVDARPDASRPIAKNSATVGPSASCNRGVRALDGVGVGAALQVGGRDQQHGQVHGAGHDHRQRRRPIG